MTTYLPHSRKTVPMLPGSICESPKNYLACSICHGAWRNLEDVALCFFGHQEYVDWRKEQWKQVTLHIYPRLEKEES